MGKFVDLTDQRFGKLTAIKPAGKSKQGNYLWECKCDCGDTTTPQGRSLTNGNTTSCGCHKRSVLPISTTTHGMANTHVYFVFHAMHKRCSNPVDKDYHSYGARGITVCERWKKQGGFTNFLADMGTPPDGMSIERKNTNGNYAPENCVWATPTDQANNKRTNRYITWRNQTRTLTAWAKILDKSASWLWKRIDKYPFEKAMEPFNQIVDR